MILHFPNRFMWLIVGFVILFLLQSGCQPIQPPADARPTTTSEESGRANLSTEMTSPDGQWIATTLFQVPRGSDDYYQSLVVTHDSGAPSYTLVDGWLPWGLGYTLPVLLTWSQDGEGFYYTNRPNPDGCGLLGNGSDLYRVELATGETVELLPPNTTWVLGLAPDEKHIAYRTPGELTLTIHDFDLAPIVRHDPNETQDQIGAIVWSPDSSAFAFVVAHKPCSGGWAESTSIYVLDTQTMRLTPYLQKDDRLLSPVAWPSDKTLLLENQLPYGQIDQKRSFTIDMATNAVAPVADQ